MIGITIDTQVVAGVVLSDVFADDAAGTGKADLVFIPGRCAYPNVNPLYGM